MPKSKDFSELLSEVNERLKNANIKILIQQRGGTLSLRGILPAKPGIERPPHQQRVAIAPANFEGLRAAEAKAKEVDALISFGKFDWQPYLREQRGDRMGDLVKAFERNYFASRPKNAQTLKTFKHEYLQVFSRIGDANHIDEVILRKFVENLTKPDTRSRRRYALACACLLDFAGIPNDLREMVGKYSIKSVNPRSLPTDKDIAAIYDTFPENHIWLRWAFGMMATYGLRNYELWKIDYSEFPIIFVDKGKTDMERYVYPLYPEWVNVFNLDNPEAIAQLNRLAGKDNEALGNKITKGFKRVGIPFSPYNLRHAWAARAIAFHWDLSLAAAQMGHSVAIHSRVYHHWISRDVYQRAYEQLLSRSDRPLPPS